MPQTQLPDRLGAFVSVVEEVRSNEGIVPHNDYEAAFAIIRAVVVSEDGEPRELFFGLCRTIEALVELSQIPKPALELYQFLADALGQAERIMPFAQQDAWLMAAEAAEGYVRSRENRIYPSTITRGEVSGRALQRLSTASDSLIVEDFQVRLKPERFTEICNSIESRVARLGGLNVIDNIFRTFREQNQIHRGLFLYGRKMTPLTGGVPQLQIPWHFLFNLSLKHIDAPTNSKSPAADWTTMIEDATDLAASMDVQEFNPLGGLSGLSPYSFHLRVTEYVTYDELFSFQQWSSEAPETLFGWWLEALSKAGVVLPNDSFEGWRVAGEALLSIAVPDRPRIIDRIELIQRAQDCAAMECRLADLACPRGETNKAYQTPYDTEVRNAPNFPIFALELDRYFLPPRGLAARGLYERLASLIRSKAQPSLNNKLGAALEILTRKVLEAASIPVTHVSEKYRVPGLVKKTARDRDTDVVSVVEGRITFVECKMKPLTTRSRGARTAPAIVDFIKAYLLPLTQAFRHEIALRRSGEIAFSSGRRLEWAHQKIDHCVITMLDHGSLQNAIFRKDMAAALLRVNLEERVVDGEKEKEQIRDCNRILTYWRSAVLDLAALYDLSVDKFMQSVSFNTTWLSIDQLAVLIPGSSSLHDAMAPIRHITFGTGDLMNEFAASQQMHERAQAAALNSP